MQLDQLTNVFHATVGDGFNTRLQGGASEPLYRPGEPAVIYFRDDYVSSALHEIAHWCIAGPARRQQEDYGYWYSGNRDETEQRAFECAESRPQALEWIMSEAAGIQFRVSFDNFDELTLDIDGFRNKVRAEVPRLLLKMPRRAAMFVDGLIQQVGSHGAYRCETYRNLPN